MTNVKYFFVVQKNTRFFYCEWIILWACRGGWFNKSLKFDHRK